MKKIIVILIFIIVANTKNVNAQTTPVTDTLGYLQTIIANKSSFIGQPFSVLFDSLKIQIKHFSPFASLHYDKTKETSTSFSFYFSQTIDDWYSSFPRLKIVWQTPLNATQSDVLWSFNNGGGWSTIVYNFYSTNIIADIKIRE